MWSGNNQGNFQVHRFTTSENIAKSFKGGGVLFDSHSSCTNCTAQLNTSTLKLCLIDWPPPGCSGPSGAGMWVLSKDKIEEPAHHSLGLESSRAATDGVTTVFLKKLTTSSSANGDLF